jgi:hypothetical protein
VEPSRLRRNYHENTVNQIGWAMYNHAPHAAAALVLDKKTNKLSFKTDILKDLQKQGWFGADALTDPMGAPITLESLAKIEKGFTAERLGRAVTHYRIQQVVWAVGNYCDINKQKFLKDGKWTLPDTVVADALKHHGYDKMWHTDTWGNGFKMVKVDKKWEHATGHAVFDEYQLVSAGPDGKFGTDDDVKMVRVDQWQMIATWWLPDDARAMAKGVHPRRRGRGEDIFLFDRAEGMRKAADGRPGLPVPGAAPGGPGGGRFPGDDKKDAAKEKGPIPVTADPGNPDQAGGAPTRLREYFPETMLWRPALITDDKGIARLNLDFADSITTWRLTASASSKGGSLGGTTAPLRVFQDFFVDLDLPVALTQNDEVAFPVAVYNYLKTPQTVKLTLKQEAWFELVDGLGLERSLDVKPSEVTSVKFRIRAKKNGTFPLTVEARGNKMSDAIKRSIDVMPDGKKVEQVVSDRLSGNVTQTITIPQNAVEDASRLYVKVYPGVFSQVLEGTEGLLRLPGG